MKYFSEDIVREMVKEAEDIAFVRSCGVKTAPLDIEDYPSIEIPDEHGRIIDAGPLEKLYDNLEADNGIYMEDAGETLQRILDAPTILEASK